MKQPFEDSIENTLKSSGEAGSFHVQKPIPFTYLFDKPIYLERPKNQTYAFLGKDSLRRARIDSSYEGTVIVQGEDRTIDELIASLKSRYDDVVTLDDLEHETINKVKNNIVSDYDWNHVTEECEHHGVLFDPGDSEAVVRSWWLCRIVKEFISAQDAELIRYAVEKNDPDFSMRALASSFLNFYSGQTDHLQRAGLKGEDLKIHGFYAGLELLACGIQNAKDLVPSDTLKSGVGWEAVESVCDEVLTSVAKTEKARFDALKSLAVECHVEHREDFVWGEDDTAWDSALPSASKARIFMKAVAQMKAAGVLVTIPVLDRQHSIVAVCVTRFQGIHCRNADVERVAELFEQKPWISADRLTEGFRFYMRMFTTGLKRGEGFKKSRFYSTRMASVSWFLRHLDKIVKEMEGDYGELFNRLRAPK